MGIHKILMRSGLLFSLRRGQNHGISHNTDRWFSIYGWRHLWQASISKNIYNMIYNSIKIKVMKQQ